MTEISAQTRNEAGPAGRRAGPGFIRTADGVDLFHREWGKDRGRRKPVVFVSSWSLPSDSWWYSMLPLSERGHRCVAYDRRGHGRSTDPGTGYDFDTLADDLAAVLDALDLTGATLVGHSMACGEIVRYLARHGSARVARIVLVSTTTPLLLKTQDNPDGFEASVFEEVRNRQFMRDFPQWVEDNLRPFALPETPAPILDWVRGMALTASLQAVVELNRSLSTTDFREDLRRIDVPALLIHGDRDVSSPIGLTALRTAELLPGAVLKVYEGAPHGLFVTHPERLNADIETFIGATPDQCNEMPAGHQT
jgi:pimeloyl-ACP methyl ester carboxylesterase